jgi:hypothetical protein
MFDFDDLFGLHGIDNDSLIPIDLDGDGEPDVFGLDIDGDGHPDVFASDTDGDGAPDAFALDTDGDENPDMFGFDTDGDGNIDAYGIDTNGDGTPDIFGFDTDGNGTVDVYSADTDNDGIFDTNYFDDDNDGVIDTVQHTYSVDLDNDGVADMIVTDTDLGADGTVDHSSFLMDSDGDTVMDTFGEMFSVDTDGNGVADSLQFNIDYGLDNVFDVSGIVNERGEVSFFDQIADAQNSMPLNEAELNSLACYNAENAQHFNPQSYDSGNIIGDPAGAMNVYHTQHGGTCGVVSQEFVLDQLLGRDYSEDNLRDYAESRGWYSEEGGTPLYDIGNLLETQGLHVIRDEGNTLSDIADCLENGGGVIVGVDLYELYHIEHDGPGMGVNHAVQVIGIDNSDPSHPMVILNDSSNPDGHGAMIPAGDFLNAWEDSNYFMAEAYADDGGMM